MTLNPMNIPDRTHVLTEQRNPRTMGIHCQTVGEIVRAIQAEDREVLDALQLAQPAIISLIEAIEVGFQIGGRVVYIGAGTSGRLGVLDASEIPPTFHVPPGRFIGIIAGGESALRVSSEGKEDERHGADAELTKLGLSRPDTVIGIAAGGSTPYVLGALEIAKSIACPPVTAMISCSPIEKPPHCDHLIVIPTGPEVVTGSTRMKAGTATKLALNQISTTLMIRSGRVFENLMVDLKASNDKLKDRAARIIVTLTGASRDEAFRLIEEAQGSVKVAVVMKLLGLSRDEAQVKLNAAGGHLHKALM
jgi:N-acetylmuramic acid 6-phosphate etherase